MQYYCIIGYGINVTEIRDRIVPEKWEAFAKEHNINLENGFIDPDDDDFLFETPYYNLAEIFVNCDDTHLLVEDAGDDGSYLFYTPKYPWWQNFEMVSETRVQNAIIDAVQKLTDMSAKEIRERIDYIEDVIYG